MNASAGNCIRALVAAAFGFVAQASQAQTAINIALGPPGSAPAASYAAAGLPGVWNDIGLTPIGQRVPLVGLDGNPIAADIRQVGVTSVLQSNDPATSGDDEALLDSMVLSFCNPLDACYWIDNLPNGEYLVTLYALTPNDPDLLSPVRVDDGTPGPTPLGGAWTGTHVQGVSYQSFAVTITSNEIGLHSGTPGGNFQSGLNGIQIRPLDMVGVNSTGAMQSALVGAYPNPAVGVQTIEMNLGAGAGPMMLEIVDVTGRVVWAHRWNANEGRSFISWDGRRADSGVVAPGVYFAKLSTPAGSGVNSLKLVRAQ
jgi:hypothetical protein